MNMNGQNPVLVEVTRGDAVESRHRGAIAVVTATGEVVRSWGRADAPVLPRSAIKALQALALVETGAADHFNVSGPELAIACSSHSAEPEHLQMVEKWLRRLGLQAADLECGAKGSMEEKANEERIRADQPLTRIHNTCSGKHAGFLSTAAHMGEPTAGYIGADHPIQKRVLDIVQEMADVDLADAPRGRDGCGIPVIAMPLSAMALGFAKMAAPGVLAPERARAARRLTAAIEANPLMIAGHGRFDTDMITASTGGPKGPARVKTGAEGVHGGILPGLGLGIALKIDDGAKRAAEVAMAGVLNILGVYEKPFQPVVVNAMDEAVGVIRATLTDGGER